jgi:hypothetical protein
MKEFDQSADNDHNDDAGAVDRWYLLPISCANRAWRMLSDELTGCERIGLSIRSISHEIVIKLRFVSKA